ncbi:vacuolar membrane protein-domain-containing protein [Phakopsora pachyrhizi]|uniref:Vaculolar membrane protein-domain-containing protein n=1 Tax=Phakopsora pachyrhizi TaxID=170000 RepID=A0AAV0AWM0_PHAPC|nr:vacuolar membrane protein-domain-containing protein [Phakopsora pachyrhizi]CAH7674581.1 Vaculolar membrane protein-domain-containing protein [Phakopsora pachyrhizi]
MIQAKTSDYNQLFHLNSTSEGPILQSMAKTFNGPAMDTESCQLLGPFAIAIQALMALIIMASLLFKRHRENPKRKFKIWTADVSKQVIGQAFVHMLNVWISGSTSLLPSRGNPCALYFINIFIDTTIGVFILYVTLLFFTKSICKAFKNTPVNLGLCSGVYPNPFLVSWSKQLGIYLTSLVILKLLVIWIFWIGGEALIKFGDSLMESISLNAKVQILVVVMIGPTCLNVLQFLLIDSFLKHSPTQTRSRQIIVSSSDECDVDDHRKGSDPSSDPEAGFLANSTGDDGSDSEDNFEDRDQEYFDEHLIDGNQRSSQPSSSVTQSNLKRVLDPVFQTLKPCSHFKSLKSINKLSPPSIPGHSPHLLNPSRPKIILSPPTPSTSQEKTLKTTEIKSSLEERPVVQVDF